MPMALTLPAGQPDDLAPRAAELSLERRTSLGRRVEMLLEKLFENVHEYFRRFQLSTDSVAAWSAKSQ